MASNGLPEGWEQASIGDTVVINYGKGLREDRRKPGKVPVYGSNGVVGHNDKALTTGPTIIIGRKGTVGAVHYSAVPCWPIDTTYFVSDFRGLDPTFLTFALSRLGLAELDTSSAIPGLNRDNIYECDLPLPPPPEQRRIVAKVDELLTEVSAVRERLTRIPVLLKRFRQAVLSAACSGRLTEDWRARDNSVSHAQDDWVVSGEHAVDDNLPPTWVLASLGQVSERVSVGHVGPTSKFYCGSEGIPFVRSQNVRPGKLDMTGIRHITDEFHSKLRKSQLRPGDILVVRVGANRGDTCVVPLGCEPLNCANVVFARPRPGISRFLELYCQSDSGHEALMRMTTGAAQGVINTKSVAGLAIPLPPRAEMEEIVRRVGAAFQLSDGIAEQVARATKRVEKLTQAILAKAFRGELVPTEAELARRERRGYEPASALLERVRRERATNCAVRL